MKRLVLLGAPQGPWCGIQEIKNPVLRVSGLKKGVVDLVLKDVSGATHLCGMSEDGVYPLADGTFLPPLDSPLAWARASASHPSSSLICLIESSKAA